uniref:DNA repair protein XRCC1 n=2 Tax=Lygus hesperus TaxID=30085 RepID=A0A0A9XHU0_LYGHE
MADDYEDDIDDFLADSGSEFEPESESGEESIVSDADVDLSPVRTRKPKKPKAQQNKDINGAGKTPKRNIPTPKDRDPPKKKAKVAAVSHFSAKPKKPFRCLMDDVVFVISGFQNPLRSDIRNSALAMGAKYKADWDSTCTHLVCAFRNTPKFNQVRGSGKIVKKDWIEKCYEARKRFPWRRFALDPSDQTQPESDEEILEDTGPPPATLDNRRRVNDSSSDEDEIEKEVKRIKKQHQTTPKPKAFAKPVRSVDNDVNDLSKDDESSANVAGPSGLNLNTRANNSSPPQPNDSDSERIETVIATASSSKKVTDVSIFEVETEEEASDDERNSTLNVLRGLPTMPSYFESYNFLLLDDIEETQRATLRRYILARLGNVVSDIQELSSPNPSYCITEDKSRFEEVKESFPNVVGVRPDWVWFCHDENSLQDVNSYVV